jgi:ferric-dicitrate binding protein FerR (iron transport regulator)
VSVEVTNGHELTYDVTGVPGEVHPTDSKSVAELLNASLQYRRRPLREVIEDVQHYIRRHIEIDPAAGELPFTGVIGRENIESWVHELHRTMPVETVDAGSNRLSIRRVASPTDPAP